MTDLDYMKLALELAQKGLGFVHPNPLVGAVIVKNGEIIGAGWHKKCGDLHAERNAFADCDSRGIDCSGADLYVTLEPCCHYGKTPPCTEAIIAHRIKRVFVGSPDPNPLVAGKGIRILRNSGITVIENVLRKECDRINDIFFHYITTHRPFVTMKYAMTMDGKIACHTGESKWITSAAARQHVQRERLRHTAIMTGIGTVLADDPMLTCRLKNGRDPVRIICDSDLRIPLQSNIVRTARTVQTIIASAEDSDKDKATVLEVLGCIVLRLPRVDGHIDLNELMRVLAKKYTIDSILLEGGAELNWSALNSGIVSKVLAYVAPKMFGGADAKSPVGGLGVDTPDSAFMLTDTRVSRIGEDFIIESKVKKKCLLG